MTLSEDIKIAEEVLPGVSNSCSDGENGGHV